MERDSWGMVSHFASSNDLVDEREKITQERVCNVWMREQHGMELMAHSTIPGEDHGTCSLHVKGVNSRPNGGHIPLSRGESRGIFDAHQVEKLSTPYVPRARESSPP